MRATSRLIAKGASALAPVNMPMVPACGWSKMNWRAASGCCVSQFTAGGARWVQVPIRWFLWSEARRKADDASSAVRDGLDPIRGRETTNAKPPAICMC